MILNGVISTPTTSADMKSFVDIGARENQPEIPLRSVPGQFGPLTISVKVMVESSSELVRNNADEMPKEISENLTFTESLLRHAMFWKNAVILWFYKTIFTLFDRKKATK